MYLSLNRKYRFSTRDHTKAMLMIVCAVHAIVLSLITGCTPIGEYTTSNHNVTVSYQHGDAGQKMAREVCYRMLKDSLTPLPHSVHWGSVHPLDQEHDRLSGGKIFYDNNNLNPNAPVTIIGTYWLVTDPPQNSGKFLATIIQYWRDHGWNINDDSDHKLTGISSASPPYAPDYVITPYLSMHNSLSVAYRSAPFLREHDDGISQPDSIDHP